MTSDFEIFEIIDRYTRADMVADGSLVDVTATAQEAGFTVPMALTRAAWVDTVEWDRTNPEPQDEDGRLWDVIFMARGAARRAQDAGVVDFQILRIPNERRSHLPMDATIARLRLYIGPGDAGEPVLTIALDAEEWD